MIRFGSRQIHDVHRYGVLSFTDVIVKSSNVGAIKVGLKLGPERLGRYVSRFGFGQTLLPGLPRRERRASSGTRRGSIPARWRRCRWAIRSASRRCRWRRPSARSPTAGRSTSRASCARSSRTASARRCRTRRCGARSSERTAAQLTAIMEAVVERGTAKAAQIDGYTIAGKTGTAHKVINGGYSQSEYNASFVGFVPSRKPALTIIVVIDSPHGKGYTGGAVAAPIFKRIAEASLRHLGIAPTVNPAPPVLVAGTTSDRGVVAGAPESIRRGQPGRSRRTWPRRPDAGPARPERARRQSGADQHRHDRPPQRRRLRPRAVAGGGHRARAGRRLRADARPAAAARTGAPQ